MVVTEARFLSQRRTPVTREGCAGPGSPVAARGPQPHARPAWAGQSRRFVRTATVGWRNRSAGPISPPFSCSRSAVRTDSRRREFAPRSKKLSWTAMCSCENCRHALVMRRDRGRYGARSPGPGRTAPQPPLLLTARRGETVCRVGHRHARFIPRPASRCRPAMVWSRSRPKSMKQATSSQPSALRSVSIRRQVPAEPSRLPQVR